MDNNNSFTSLSKAVEAIKTAILQSQERAAKGVNVTQLSLYFSIGRFVSINSRLQKWGMVNEKFQPLIGEIQSPSATELKIGNNNVE